MSDQQDNEDMPPWLQPVDGDVKQQDNIGMEGTMKKFVVGLAFVIIAAFAFGIWFFYDRPTKEIVQPIDIFAPTTAIKEKPVDAGGMDIPNQDKEVYKRVTGEADTNEVSLSEQAEVPVATLPKETQEKPKEVFADIPKKLTAPEGVDGMHALSGTHLIQVGAFGNVAGAESTWVQLVAKYPGYFAKLAPIFQSISRESDGKSFVRLRIGPFYSRADAEQMCQSLKARQQACLVVTK